MTAYKCSDKEWNEIIDILLHICTKYDIESRSNFGDHCAWIRPEENVAPFFVYGEIVKRLEYRENIKIKEPKESFIDKNTIEVHRK
ncbi:MAG: hypothetical protein GTN36_05985 [Candidatus Aenigmarchaeota archaeon]|nr:hypothetical protein [Candidatus Aenigmarchaeota archaeon]